MHDGDGLDGAAVASTRRVTSFAPGPNIGLIGESTLAVLEPMNAALAEMMWSIIERGGGADDVLEQLSSAGLRSLGSFAIVQFEADEVRVVVRGSGAVRVGAPTGILTVVADDVRTWHEVVVGSPQSVVLHLGALSTDRSPFHVERGIVPASVLICEPSRSAHLEPHAVESFAPPAIDEVVIPDRPHDLSSTLSVDEFLRAAEIDMDDVADVEPAAPVEPAVPVEPAALVEPAAPVEPSAPLPPPSESVDERNEYDDMWGHTMVRPVESAAVRQSEADAVAPTEEHPIIESSTLIAAVPSPAGGSELPPPVPAATTPQLGDHDGHTMTRAQIQALRSAAAAGAGTGTESASVPTSNAPAMGGPSVQALMCPGGHPNPPHLSRCRLCSQGLGTTPVLVARPLLGSLRFSNGTVVNLDRPALIGRNPKLEGALPSELPTLVRLDVGHGLSRSHALVRIEGWQVLVEDLNSANGTIVQNPGRQPQRLHPGEPMLVEHRTTIDLGGELTCTVELL